MVQNMFPDKNKDYVISVGEHDIVLVKEIKPNYDMREIEKIAKTIADTLLKRVLREGHDRYRYRCRQHQGPRALLQGGSGRD